ncbi:MAG: hypothetical protein M1830_008706 [Pleopsidium flavum]|nr:MAG: hypothetical protein M1830_008706 [Pleopsidium flavum]
MASSEAFDDFTVIGRQTPHNTVYGDFERHSNADCTFTDVVVSSSLRSRHPDLALTISPVSTCNLLSFASTGQAEAVLDPRNEEYLLWRSYQPPARRLDGAMGSLADQILFARYNYRWDNHDFIVYIVNGARGNAGPFGGTLNNYILHKPEGNETVQSQSAVTDKLITAASKYNLELHKEILVFDQGWWQKSRELWESVQKASWSDVILDEKMKESLIGDVEGFFDERDTYREFSVPWKRGIIFHGPPGNGKTISIKALMKSLSTRENPLPTLYVKSLVSFRGPEYSIRQIFLKARAQAPCLLVFEDLDSLVTDQVRSYFLNEVDGLERNDGILMIGSTNHLDRLDPGIAKRPSRFDRKYLFPLPSRAERTEYCEYWRQKLRSNKKIGFPKRLCGAIAGITDQFSFAYMKEAFVATLLVIVAGREVAEGGGDDFDGLMLWVEIKRQIKILRDEI